jgi:hypothetical protein
MRQVLAPLIIGGVVLSTYGAALKNRPYFLIGLWLFVGGLVAWRFTIRGWRKERQTRAQVASTGNWTRTEFRKALLDCENATNVGLDQGLNLVAELHACSLLMLNFRDRLLSTQQKDLSELAAACDFPGGELHGDPEED